MISGIGICLMKLIQKNNQKLFVWHEFLIIDNLNLG
jgi:hypothetical protein